MDEKNEELLKNSNLPTEYKKGFGSKIKSFFGKLFNRNSKKVNEEAILENTAISNEESLSKFNDDLKADVVDEKDMEEEKEIPIKNEYERRLNKRTVNNRINDERRAARISACVMGAGVVGCLVATGMKYTPDQLDAILKLEAQSLQSFEALKGYFASFSPAMLGSCVTAVSGAIHYRRHAREERNARRELNDMNEVEKELESR